MFQAELQPETSTGGANMHIRTHVFSVVYAGTTLLIYINLIA